jgi:cell wall-associated NlpC family hydrolase
MPPAQVDQALQQGYDTITGATPAAQPIGPPTVAPAPADMGPPTITPPPASAPDTDPVQAAITAAAQAAQVDPALLRALIHQESNFDPRAVSGAGAQGLGQLMPGTARELGVSDPFDPAQNARAAAAYLKNQLDAFGGDIDKALAAYNAGPGAVRQYGGIPPYAETRNYVQRVRAFYDAEKQGALNPFRSTNTNTTSDTSAAPTTNLSADALKKQATAALWAAQQIGSQAWNELCQRFVEQTYGTEGRFLTAKAASNDLIPHFGQAGADNLKNAPLGALVYFSADPTNGFDGHAGIYVGNGQMVSATPSGVQKTDILGDPYYGQRYVGWAAPPPEWQGRPADGSIADGAQRLVDAFNAGTPAAALTLDPTQQTEAPPEPPAPTDQGTADEAAAAQQRQTQPTDQGEPPKNVSPSVADPTAEAVREALGLTQGPTDLGTAGGPVTPEGETLSPSDEIRRLLNLPGADRDSLVGRAREVLGHAGVNMSLLDRVLGFRGVYKDASSPGFVGEPGEGDTRTSTEPTPQQQRHEADVLRLLLDTPRDAPQVLDLIDRAQAGMATPRSVADVMSAGPNQVDAERLTSIIQIIARDAQLDPAQLAQMVRTDELAQADNPGQHIFDAIWFAIADEYGLPASTWPQYVRGMLAGVAQPQTQTEEPDKPLYHGTGSGFPYFIPEQLSPNSLYGPGMYLTSDPRVAGSGTLERPGYAEATAKNFGDEVTKLERDIQEEQAEQESLRSGPLHEQFPDWEDRVAESQQRVDRWQRRLDEIGRHTAAQVRPMRLPSTIRLLDVEQPVPEGAVERIRKQLGGDTPDESEVLDNFDAELSDLKQRGEVTGDDLYQALVAATNDPMTRGRSPEYVTDVLSAAGFDGIHYSGGQRIPMIDEAGNPINHEAYVIFPDKMGKVRNALTGLPEGELGTDQDQLQFFLQHNPDLAESLGTLLGMQWTTNQPPDHAPWEVWSVGQVNQRKVGPLNAGEFPVTFGAVQSAAEWNTLLGRLRMLGVVAVDDYYDPQGGAGTVILRGIDPEMVRRVREQLTIYERRGAAGRATAPTAPRQPTPYEVFPALYQEVPNAQTP